MITLKRIEQGLYSYLHTHSDNNTLEYRVGLGSKFTGNIYLKRRWIVAVFSENKRIALGALVPDDKDYWQSHLYNLTNWFTDFEGAKNALDGYISQCVDEDYPSPVELSKQTTANYQRAMRAIVDKLIDNNFAPVRERHISVYASGGYDPNDTYYDFSIAEVLENEVSEDINRVMICGHVYPEAVDTYRNVIEALDDSGETGSSNYSPVDIVDDPKDRFAWHMRVLANELIENDFKPFGYPDDLDAEFSLVIEPYEYAFIIYALTKKGDERNSKLEAVR